MGRAGQGEHGEAVSSQNMLFSAEQPPSPSRASPFPRRPEAHPQAPPARPWFWVHLGRDAEPSCPCNLWLVIMPMQGSAPSRLYWPPALLLLHSAQPQAVPSPSSPGSALKADRRKRQRAPPATLGWGSGRVPPAAALQMTLISQQ